MLHFHPLPGNCEVSVCLGIVAFECSLSNSHGKWMGHYHYIQEKIISFRNSFFSNYVVIRVFSFVVC